MTNELTTNQQNAALLQQGFTEDDLQTLRMAFPVTHHEYLDIGAFKAWYLARDKVIERIRLVDPNAQMIIDEIDFPHGDDIIFQGEIDGSPVVVHNNFLATATVTLKIKGLTFSHTGEYTASPGAISKMNLNKLIKAGAQAKKGAVTNAIRKLAKDWLGIGWYLDYIPRNITTFRHLQHFLFAMGLYKSTEDPRAMLDEWAYNMTSCAEWAEALHMNRYNYFVKNGLPSGQPQQPKQIEETSLSNEELAQDLANEVEDDVIITSSAKPVDKQVDVQAQYWVFCTQVYQMVHDDFPERLEYFGELNLSNAEDANTLMSKVNMLLQQHTQQGGYSPQPEHEEILMGQLVTYFNAPQGE